MKSHRLLRADAARIWASALRSVEAEASVRENVKRVGTCLYVGNRHFDLKSFRKVWVLGAGKAAAPMGRALEKILGKYLAGGVLSTKYGHAIPLRKIQVIEAGHPLPDFNGIAASWKMISLIRSQLQAEDLVFCLFSGGASSLLVSPAEGIVFEDKLECTRLMLNGGADIFQMNAVRKHLSSIKGGGLARMLAPANVISLILSDVVGDDVSTIASGPVAPDATTFGNCIEIFKELQLSNRIPAAVRLRFELGDRGAFAETPKEGDPVFNRTQTVIVGNNAQACTAAAKAAKGLGYHTMVLTSSLEGDTAEAARFHMGIAEEILSHARPLRRPACIISGGETTVRVNGNGKGGRNQEFTLQCIHRLSSLAAPCVVASLGTDGTDGPTDAAGALADNNSLRRSTQFGVHYLNQSINNNDSYNYFKELGDLIVTGPTRTNVMDLHLVLLG